MNGLVLCHFRSPVDPPVCQIVFHTLAPPALHQSTQDHDPDLSTLNLHVNLVQFVALVAIMAVSTSHPSRALDPEEKSSLSDCATWLPTLRLTKGTITPGSVVSNTYNDKQQDYVTLTNAGTVLHAGFERDDDHCLELGL